MALTNLHLLMITSMKSGVGLGGEDMDLTEAETRPMHESLGLANVAQ